MKIVLKKEKAIKSIKIGKKNKTQFIHLFTFIIYVEYSKIFLYASNKQLENEILKTIFKIA